MPVLYRKYRPQTFNEVVGQQAIVQTLRNAVVNGTPAHAYLFTGSRGVGKTSVARILARAINCPKQKKGEACLSCDICQQFNAGTFLDLIEIDAASNTGVDNIRELIEHVRFTPSQGKFKVFIIDEAHMLSKGAFNALLKTLEEPPAHAIFILATTEAHKVPLTIISRTQRFDFQRLSEADIAGYIKKVAKQETWNYDDEVLALIARQSEGSLRDALSLLDKLAVVGDKLDRADVERLLGLTDARVSQELLDAILARTPERLPELFDNWLEAGIDFSIFNKNLLEYLRRLLMIKIGGANAGENFSVEERQALQRQADQITVNQLMHVIRLFLRSYKELPFSPSPDLPVLLSSIEASYKLSGGGGASEVTQPNSVIQGLRPVGSGQSQLSRSRGGLVPDASRALAVSESASRRGSGETRVGEAIDSVFRRAAPDRANASRAAAVIEQEVDTSVTEAQIKENWPGIIEEIKKINSPLATLVRNSPIVEVKDGLVTVEVKYLFHKEHLESTKQRALVSEAIFKTINKRAGISARLVKPEAFEGGDTVNLLTDALRVFGGELVE